MDGEGGEEVDGMGDEKDEIVIEMITCNFLHFACTMSCLFHPLFQNMPPFYNSLLCLDAIPHDYNDKVPMLGYHTRAQ